MKKEEIIRGAGSVTSPAYVFDADAFLEKIERIDSLLGDRASVCYAMKANPFLVSVLKKTKVEVCSPGEFAICERNKVDMRNVVLSGVNKEAAEIRRVMSLYHGLPVYTAESESQFRLLADMAAETGDTISVLLRLSAGNQFGMDEETICKIIEKRDELPMVHIEGIQFYSGTQKKKLALIQKEIDRLDAFLTKLNEEYGYTASELEYGPGLYVPYFIGEAEDVTEDTIQCFKNMLDGMHFQGKFTIEMGRYLAASSGYYYTGVVDEKVTEGERYAIAEGGIHQLNYYGQMMAMKVPHYYQICEDGQLLTRDGQEEELSPVTLCGSLCTVNDILVRSISLKVPVLHTTLVFENCGAYSVTEGMALFLSRDLPRVYLYQGGEFILQRDRMESNNWNSFIK